MGSQKIQDELWGKNPIDWAEIQEPTGLSGYEHALQWLKLKSGQSLLDVGCGTGLFSDMAFKQGAKVSGVDACENLIDQAKKRNSEISFSTGEMEELPFSDSSYEIVCGFNSFQYAASIKNALTEAKRVLKEDGKLVLMIWGNKEDCEAGAILKAIGRQMPPPPPGAGGPFALSENQLLENNLEEVGFKIISNEDVDSIWKYQNIDTAVKGLMSSGPAAKAIAHSGFQKVNEAIENAFTPFLQDDSTIVNKNKWRVVISEK